MSTPISPDLIVIFLILFFLFILLFILFREVLCWYWKINAGISLLQDIKSELQKITISLPKEEKKETL